MEKQKKLQNFDKFKNSYLNEIKQNKGFVC